MQLHANAALSLNKRRRLCRRVVEEAWSLAEAAAAAEVSERTASKWVRRYRAEGEPGLLDRCSAPRVVANRTDELRIEAIGALRRLRFTGPEIAQVLALSTVSGILTRIGMGKLGRLGLEPPQRYERERPGELIHIDVKKLGRIEGGAGHRMTGRRRDTGRRSDREGVRRLQVGWEFVHIAIDDCTRLAYAEVLPDERATTAIAFLRRALAFYRRHGIRVERLLTDNGSAYRSTVHAIASARWASVTCAPGPTVRRRTARPNASSARCSEAGPMARSTAPAQNAAARLTAGSGTTTMSADTAPSATNRPSPAYASRTTCSGLTTSAPRGGRARSGRRRARRRSGRRARAMSSLRCD
jgi:Integrase core domain/leucine-zipper of insertion element IS481